VQPPVVSSAASCVIITYEKEKDNMQMYHRWDARGTDHISFELFPLNSLGCISNPDQEFPYPWLWVSVTEPEPQLFAKADPTRNRIWIRSRNPVKWNNKVTKALTYTYKLSGLRIRIT
jgi:hypothetical protein